MDILDFTTILYHKYRYVLNIIDDYSSYGTGYNLTAKSDIFNAFKEFYTLVEVQDGIKIKKIHVDNEFVTNEFKNFCAEKGIILAPSAPHEHQQNVRIKRFNQTIHEKLEAMRHMACIPPSWWEFSVQAAYVVYNMTPLHRQWNKERNWETPYQLRYGKKPDVSKL
jgi:transposase InsO family protein